MSVLSGLRTRSVGELRMADGLVVFFHLDIPSHSSSAKRHLSGSQVELLAGDGCASTSVKEWILRVSQLGEVLKSGLANAAESRPAGRSWEQSDVCLRWLGSMQQD
jgi:hypothetical protein